MPEDIFHRTYMAAWLFRLLRSGNYLPENVKSTDSADNRLSDEELFIAGLLLHNLQLLQFNSHEVRTMHDAIISSIVFHYFKNVCYYTCSRNY